MHDILTREAKKGFRARYVAGFAVLAVAIAVLICAPKFAHGSRSEPKLLREGNSGGQGKPTTTATPTPTPCRPLCPCVCPPDFPDTPSDGSCPAQCKCDCQQPGGRGDKVITISGGSVTIDFDPKKGEVWDNGGRFTIRKKASFRPKFYKLLTAGGKTVTDRPIPISGRFTMVVLTMEDGSSPEPITITGVPTVGSPFGEGHISLSFSTTAFPKVVKGDETYFRNEKRRIVSLSVKDDVGIQGRYLYTLGPQCLDSSPSKRCDIKINFDNELLGGW